MELKISRGNTKTGRLPAVSGVPGKDCPAWVNRYCGRLCYAKKAFRQYPATRKAWKGNSMLWRRNPFQYEANLRRYLTKKRPVFFRFHVAGDFIDLHQFAMAARVARDYPDTKFMAFTKRYTWIPRRLSDNFQVILSVWQGMPRGMIPKRIRDRFPHAYAGHCEAWPGYHTAIECPGGCDTCGLCWDLSRVRKNVRFNLH